MSFSVGLNKVLNSKWTSATIFTVAGAGKVIHDYRKAPQEEKKDVLVKESTILMSSALGMFLYSSAKNTIKTSNTTKKIVDFAKKGIQKLQPKNKEVKKAANVVMQDGIEIFKNCADNLLLLGSGIFGGIAADELMESKYVQKLNKKFEKQSKEIAQKEEEINQEKEPQQEVKQLQKRKNNRFSDFRNKLEGKDIQTYIESDTSKNIVSNISNIPEMKVFSNTMVGLQTLKITEEKTFRAKMKKMTHDLMSGTMLPLFFMSTASVLTKKTRALYRVPIVLGTMIAGPVLIKNVADVINQRREQKQQQEEKSV